MAELKTKQNDQNVGDFLNRLSDEKKQQDCRLIMEMMERVTACPARMWGDAIIGFGSYRYKYASGREGDWFLMGLSPRKQNISIYLMSGLELLAPLLERLGKHKTSKSCLYIKKIEDIDLAVLELMCRQAKEHPMGAERKD